GDNMSTEGDSRSSIRVESEFRNRLSQVVESFGSVVMCARTVGVSDNAIYKWLAGRGQPTVANLVALANAARVSLEWLATGQEPTQSSQAVTQAITRGDYIFMPRNQVRFPSGRHGLLRSDQVVDFIAFRSEWVRRRLNTDPRDLILIEVVGDSM